MKGIKQEHEIIKALGITKEQLDDLRRSREFPFVQVTKSVRIYFEKSVERWLAQNEKNIGHRQKPLPTNRPPKSS